MILDGQNLFSDAQAITAAAASTNVIDLGPGASRDIGTGENLYLFVSVDVAMTDAGSDSTVTVTIQGDSTTTFTPDGSQDAFIIPATSAAGSIFYYRLNPGSAPLQFQFIRLLYTPNNGNLTTGSFTAGLVHDIDKFKAYASGYTVS